MKKAILVILIALTLTFSFSFFGTDTVAYAEEGDITIPADYRANSDIQVYRYLEESNDEVELFVIPNTYYFNIYRKAASTSRYYINYNGSTNSDKYYIKTDANFVAANTEKDVSPLGGYTVELSVASDVTYSKYDGFNFVDELLTASSAPVITFIGFENSDKTRVYVSVKVGDAVASYGYVNKSDLLIKATNTALGDDIDLHPNYRVNVEDKVDSGAKKEIDNNKLTRIILIVGIVVPALVILFLLFKPNKRSHYDYDRNRNTDYGSSPYDRPRSRYRDDYDDGYNRNPPPRRRRDDYDDDDYYDNRSGGRRY